MEKIKNYNVSFFGLKDGKHTFEFKISQKFFDLFEFDQEFKSPDIHIVLEMDKKPSFLDLIFKMKGDVELTCDITNRPYRETIEGELPLIVKFGHDYDYTDDEVWVIPNGANDFNIAQLIYELVLLNIPTKHYHPDLNSEEAQEAWRLLNDYAPKAGNKEQKESESEQTNDPRWDSLKKLL